MRLPLFFMPLCHACGQKPSVRGTRIFVGADRPRGLELRARRIARIGVASAFLDGLGIDKDDHAVDNKTWKQTTRSNPATGPADLAQDLVDRQPASAQIDQRGNESAAETVAAGIADVIVMA